MTPRVTIDPQISPELYQALASLTPRQRAARLRELATAGLALMKAHAYQGPISGDRVSPTGGSQPVAPRNRAASAEAEDTATDADDARVARAIRKLGL